MIPRIRTLAAAAWTLACAVAYAGCVCPDPVERYRGDFEDCGMCGFELMPGNAGSVERVTTFHAGEHALRLRGRAEIRLAAEIPTANELALVTNCPNAIIVTVDSMGGEQAPVPIRLNVAARRPDLPWVGMSGLLVTPAGQPVAIRGVRITALGDACDVDAVRVLERMECF